MTQGSKVYTIMEREQVFTEASIILILTVNQGKTVIGLAVN